MYNVAQCVAFRKKDNTSNLAVFIMVQIHNIVFGANNRDCYINTMLCNVL